MKAHEQNETATLDTALEDIRQILLDGLHHGFFRIEVSCEIVKADKRRLLVNAGKSYQFFIHSHELSKDGRPSTAR